jgi:hypothetical protein
MEEWLQYLEASTPCVSPFQLQLGLCNYGDKIDCKKRKR